MRQYLTLPRTVYILCLGTFINRAGTLLVPFLTLYLKRQLGLSIEVATRVMGAYGAGAIVASVVGGYLADRFGRKRVMVGSLAGGAAILFVFPLFSSSWVVAAGLFTFAVVGEMYRPATQAMIADCVGAERRPQAYALIYVAVNLGFAIAPVVGGVLSEVGFRWLCWVDGSTALAYTAILFALVPETHPTTPGQTGGMAPAARVGGREAARVIARDWTMVTFCGGTLAIALMFMQIASTFPLYLQQLGIDAKHYGRIIAINGIMITFLQLPLTALVERRRREAAVVASALLMGAGFYLNAFGRTPLQFSAIVVVWTLGEMLHAAFASTIVSELAPVALRGRYMGVFTMSFASASMFGAPLGGMILARRGGHALWTAVLLLGMLAAALFALAARGIRRRTGRAGPAPAPA